MELDWLEDFLALIDSGNFSRAAEARNLTQPAFGRRIRALEDWAGAALFDRSTHRIGLTPAGERFRPFAEDIVRRVLQGREEVRHAANISAATLKFAATHVLSWTFFPRWLHSLEGRMRVGPVQLISDTMRGCEAVMRQGQAQYLICHYHPGVPDYLEAEQFRSIRVGDDLLVPLCAPDQEGRPRHPLPGRAEAPLPHLAYSPESALGWIVKAGRVGGGATSNLEPIFTSHLATVLRAVARDGRGVAWLPLSLAGDDIATGQLVRAGGPEWDAAVEIRLFRPRARQNQAAEAFWAALQQAAEG